MLIEWKFPGSNFIQLILHAACTNAILVSQKYVFILSQYIREAYVHKERKGHPRIAWKLEETVLIL